MGMRIAPKDRKLVFVDTETTGLDPNRDLLVELSYAVENMPVKTLFFGVKEVNENIDSLTNFYARGVDKEPEASSSEIREFVDAASGHTLVAANPSFDASFLKSNGMYSFAYRMLDIESYAMAKLKLDWMPGMADIYEMLTEMNYPLTQPDHSSRNDTLALRQMYYILRQDF